MGTSLWIGPFASMTKVQTGAGVTAREAPPFDRGPHGSKRDLVGDRKALLGAHQKQTSFTDCFW
jgi:hypothetical protein